MLALVILLIAMIILSGIVSASETSLTSCDAADLYARKESSSLKIAKKLIAKQRDVLSTLILANNIFNIIASIVATSICVELFGPHWGPFITVFLMTCIFITCSELLPKTYALLHAASYLTVFSKFIYCMHIILSPISRAFEMVVKTILSLFSVQSPTDVSARHFLDVLKTRVQMSGVLSQETSNMLESVINLEQQQAHDIMTHRHKLNMLCVKSSSRQCKAFLKEFTGHFILIWEGGTENLVGIIKREDLLALLQPDLLESDPYNSSTAAPTHNDTHMHLSRIMSKPWFVQQITHVRNLLEMFFKLDQSKPACIVDEYGDFVGLISINDLIREILGSIPNQQKLVQQLSDGSLLIDGIAPMRLVSKHLNIQQDPKIDANTLSGYLCGIIGNIPKTGQTLIIQEHQWHIVQSTSKQVLKIKVNKLDKA